MSSGPYLGLDIGWKRTGVAISESGILTTPLSVIESNPPHFHQLISELRRLISLHKITTVVAGIPDFQQTESSQTQRVEMIIELIKAMTDQLPWDILVTTTPEFGTTLDAATLYPGTDSDSAAAAIILQDYLDAIQA